MDKAASCAAACWCFSSDSVISLALFAFVLLVIVGDEVEEDEVDVVEREGDEELRDDEELSNRLVFFFVLMLLWVLKFLVV